MTQKRKIAIVGETRASPGMLVETSAASWSKCEVDFT